MFGRRSKLTQLVRLIPFCERNYNLIELGPKGTGKSHIYSEFSPHGILISGGEVTVPKLFVNNASGKIGLVGYWDCVAFDEFAGKLDTLLGPYLKGATAITVTDPYIRLFYQVRNFRQPPATIPTMQGVRGDLHSTRTA